MENANKSGWFERYIRKRKLNPIRLDIFQPDEIGLAPLQLNRFESVRQPLYAMLQHSGLIYGFPVQYPFEPSPAGKMKHGRLARLILVDMLLYSILLRKRKEEEIPYAEKVEEAGRLIKTYYLGVHAVGNNKEEMTIENILLRRVTFHKSYFDLRRSGINSHLFWDWYFFREYLKAVDNGDTIDGRWFEDLIWRKKEMKMLTIKLIAAAIYSDHKVTRGERVFLDHFRRSSCLMNATDKNRISKILSQGIDPDQIRLPQLSWMARRYLLDVSLLALYADKQLEAAEERYLQDLAGRLQLTNDDILESKVSLGVFLFQYGRKLHFYNRRKNGLALIGQALTENTKKITKATTLEYKETVEMANTFGRLLQHQLGIGKEGRVPTEDEIAFAIDQLKDIPKFLPFFSIMFIPVPGITEMYILLAYSIERMSGNSVRLLPSQFSRMVKGK